MRYLTAISLFLLLCLATTAQTGNLSVTKTPPPVHYGVNFVSQHGEAFNVYIDGNLQNRLPLRRHIMLPCLQTQLQIVHCKCLCHKTYPFIYLITRHVLRLITHSLTT